MRRKNMLRMSKRRQLHDVGDQDLLEEHEEALEGHAQHDQPDQEHQRLEAFIRQIVVDKRLRHLQRFRSFSLSDVSCWISRRRIDRDVASPFRNKASDSCSSFRLASATRRSRRKFSSTNDLGAAAGIGVLAQVGDTDQALVLAQLVFLLVEIVVDLGDTVR